MYLNKGFSYYLQARDIISIHESQCSSFDTERKKLQLSSDGVSESLSTSVSLDVYSVKFEKCKTIYPIRIVKTIKKHSVNENEHLKYVVNDLYENGCKITQYVADNKKRSTARDSLCHSSWFPCEYCFSKGTKMVTNSRDIEKKKESLKIQKELIAEKIVNVTQISGANSSQVVKLKNLAKKLDAEEKKLQPRKSHIVWPKSTFRGPPRTRQEIMDIIEKIENDQVMTKDEMKGIVGRSVFIDLPNFNFVNDIPVEYLHCGCLGVVKRCVELTFKVGENRPRITKRKLSLPSQFNVQIFIIKSPREFNRRIRELDFCVYKGQEFRNLIMFFFPLVVNCIEAPAKERNLWLCLAFMIRVCTIPKEEFRIVSLALIERVTKQFYSLYQELFGMKNCTYNTHVLTSHLIEIRFHGPFTATSAFPFESFYSELRNSFVPGTPSGLKQILQNVLIKRVLSHHTCENEIYYSEKETEREANNMIYCFEQYQYEIYKIISIEENVFICHTQEKSPCFYPETPNIPWNEIGVFKKEELQEIPVHICKQSVKGKVVIVDGLLITCPKNVLNEK